MTWPLKRTSSHSTRVRETMWRMPPTSSSRHTR